MRSTYSGYSVGGGSTGEHWPGALDYANSGWTRNIDNYLVRRRARAAYMDSPMFKSIISRMSDTVIDRGLMLEAVPDAQMIGLSDEDVMKWKSDVERRFHRWAMDKKSSRNGLTNFYQLQRMSFTGQFRDGEYFARLFYNKSDKLQNPLQLQLVSPDLIQGYSVTSTDGYQYNDGDGIERNAQGEEAAYNIQVYKNKRYETERIPAKGPKSGKYFMLHGFRPEFEDQTRGYSELFQALQWVQKITDLSDAQLQKEIINASIAMWVKPSQTEVATNPFENLDGNGSIFNDYESVQTPEQGEAANTGTSEDVEYSERNDINFNKPGIGIFSLKQGEELKAFEFNRNNTDYATFVNLLMEYLSSATGMPLEVLKMKFGQNYSASRAALKLFWRVAEQWRMEIATDFLNPVYESWLAGEIAAGRISAPGWSDPRLKAAWLQCNWIGPPEPDIDPSKQADSINKYLSMGLTNREREARKLNGTSYSDNIKRLAKENPELAAVTPEQEVSNGG